MCLRLGRWPRKPPFEEEMIDLFLELDEKVEELEEEVFWVYERDFYTAPDPALETYLQELEKWRERKRSHPKFWEVFAMRKKNGLDVDSFAFYMLPDDVQKRLMN